MIVRQCHWSDRRKTENRPRGRLVDNGQNESLKVNNRQMKVLWGKTTNSDWLVHLLVLTGSDIITSNSCLISWVVIATRISDRLVKFVRLGSNRKCHIKYSSKINTRLFKVNPIPTHTTTIKFHQLEFV